MNCQVTDPSPSRLRLPLNVVSPTRPKPRELVLTNYRLLCMKRKENSPGGGAFPGSRSVSTMGSGVGVSGIGTSGVRNGKDTALPSDGKEKDKESREIRSIVESAERKSDREFVVLTSMTSQTYATEMSALAAQWIDKINTSVRQYSCKR
ncbi:hypothetical protein SCLCIDRAFT_427953 [Scleroderma citrinum Foug A]|uniref:Uncharacterized protein n=1 Tax=Scleroderma citrinum Foug A TaxID=1036808 RepID=A0A0C3CYL5_9AGAM|nr:hypothetical protein SCLCIDRAFT_427953 [Scleroderma citrinum Foug A]